MLFIDVSASLLYALTPWLSQQLRTGNPAGFIGGFIAALVVEWPGHGEYPCELVLALLLVRFLRRWTRRRVPIDRILFILAGETVWQVWRWGGLKWEIRAPEQRYILFL